jgi:hypothetical protein
MGLHLRAHQIGARCLLMAHRVDAPILAPDRLWAQSRHRDPRFALLRRRHHWQQASSSAFRPQLRNEVPGRLHPAPDCGGEAHSRSNPSSMSTAPDASGRQSPQAANAASAFAGLLPAQSRRPPGPATRGRGRIASSCNSAVASSSIAPGHLKTPWGNNDHEGAPKRSRTRGSRGGSHR